MVRTVFRQLRGCLLTADVGGITAGSTGSISSGSGSLFVTAGRTKETRWTAHSAHSFRFPGARFAGAAG
jgi:hypothetical protein